MARTTEEGGQAPAEALLTQTVAFGAKTQRRKGRNINKATCHPVADADTVHLFVLKRGADCLANTESSHHSPVTLRASTLRPRHPRSMPQGGSQEGGPGRGTTGRGLPCRGCLGTHTLHTEHWAQGGVGSTCPGLLVSGGARPAPPLPPARAWQPAGSAGDGQ